MAGEKGKIIDYYGQCQIDYRLFWGTGKNLSLHYGFYDNKHRSHDSAVINMNRVMASIAKIKKGDRVLDAGCGVGGSAIWLAESMGAYVHGISISRAHVDAASRTAKKRGIDHLTRFSVKDFTDTKLPANSFDVVWGLESVCYASEKREFLKEAKRLLRKQGRLIVADGFLSKERLTGNYKRIYGKWLDGWAVPNLATIVGFRKALEGLGFRNIRVMDVTANIMPSSRRMYDAALFTLPFEWLLYIVGLRSKVQHKNTLSAYYQRSLLKNGVFRYCIFYAEK